MDASRTVLLAYVVCLCTAPLVAGIMLADTSGSRWFSRAFAASILAPWALLMFGAPSILASLVG